MNADVHALTVGPDGMIYAGGAFTTAGGGTANRIAQWDPVGAAWSSLGTGMNNIVRALAIAPNGTLYAGGSFTTAGGVTVNYIARWNGASWTGMGGGMDNVVHCLDFGPDGTLYAGGIFTIAGGITLTDTVAKWNGSTWTHLDVNFPAAQTTRAILASEYYDPVVRVNYNLFVGFNTKGTAYFAGSVIATNNGTATACLKIVITRFGGTSATLEQIRNETTGKTLFFDYDLLDGETLTMDLTPGVKSITSNFFGNVLANILPNSDFATFALMPGNNNVTCFINTEDDPEMEAFMVWKDTFWSADG